MNFRRQWRIFQNSLPYKKSHFRAFCKKDFNFFIGSLLDARPCREKWLALLKPIINWIVSSVINKFPTTRSQFNFFYFLHKTIFPLCNSLITFSCRHLTDIKKLLTQNLLIIQNPDAEHRTCTASHKHNAQYENKYNNSHSAKQNWMNKKKCYRHHSSS